MKQNKRKQVGLRTYQHHCIYIYLFHVLLSVIILLAEYRVTNLHSATITKVHNNNISSLQQANLKIIFAPPFITLSHVPLQHLTALSLLPMLPPVFHVLYLSPPKSQRLLICPNYSLHMIYHHYSFSTCVCTMKNC